MLYFANWKVLLICAVCALGVILSLPNLFTQAQLSHLPNAIPHKQVALGLDLRGGSYLLLEVDVAAAERDRLNAIIETVRCVMRRSAIPGSMSKAMRSRSRSATPTASRMRGRRWPSSIPT
jgi:preprotein translocase subunit SecD